MGLVGKALVKGAKKVATKTAKTMAATATGAFENGVGGAGRALTVETFGGQTSALGRIAQAGFQARDRKRYLPSDLQRQVALVLLGDTASDNAVARVGQPVVKDDKGNVLDPRDGGYEVIEVVMLGFIPSEPEQVKIEERSQRTFGLTVEYDEGGLVRLLPATWNQTVDAEVRRSSDGAVLSTTPVSATKNLGARILGPVSEAVASDLPRLAALIDRHYPGEVIHGMTPRDDGGWNVEVGALGDRPRFYDAQELRVADNTKPEVIDHWASQSSRRLVKFTPFPPHATIARLDPTTEGLRDRLAELTRARPDEIELQLDTVIDGGTGRLDAVTIHRLPIAQADTEKRLTTLRALRESIPGADSRWRVVENAFTGEATISYYDDKLANLIEYDWDAPVSMEQIPFGVDEDGETVFLSVLESNGLLGGIPGSGKSGGATAILAGVSRLESTALIGLDPKRVELAPWRERFSVIAKNEDHASFVLASVEAEMERRYEWIESQGLKKLTPNEFSPERPLLVVFIDELADLVSIGVSKEEKAEENFRSTRIRRLIAKGRAAGIVVFAATQKPQSDVIPTALRDLIQQRIGFATTTAAMTETILGAGMAQNGGMSHEIAASEKGVCFVVNEESRTPVRARAFWIPDAEVAGISATTAHLRIPLGWLPTEDDTADASKKVGKDVTWGDVLPDADRYAPASLFVKQGERIILPGPEQSVYNAWDNRALHASLPTSSAQETIQIPVAESHALDSTDLFKERNEPNEHPNT